MSNCIRSNLQNKILNRSNIGDKYHMGTGVIIQRICNSLYILTAASNVTRTGVQKAKGIEVTVIQNTQNGYEELVNYTKCAYAKNPTPRSAFDIAIIKAQIDINDQ